MLESALVMFGGTMYLTGMMRKHLNKKEKQKRLYKLAKDVDRNRISTLAAITEMRRIYND